jgi:hypothetical protein
MTPRSCAFMMVVLLAGTFASWPLQSLARDRSRDTRQRPEFTEWTNPSSDNADLNRRRPRGAAADTLVLGSWDFNGGGTCTSQGWTTHDLTVSASVMTHVDDFAGLGGGDFGRLHAISGSRSMWCGLRPGSLDPVACSYATLPGYGNSMSQTLTVKSCLHPTGDVVFDYYLTWDLEPSYDFVAIEIDHCDDNWTQFPGGSTGCGYYGGVCNGFTWTGEDSLVSLTIPAADHQGQFRVRIHASSDGAWSDEDGLWNTDGAYVTDDLLITDANGVVVPLEDFESAPLGATEVADWVAGTPDGYGTYAAVIPGVSTLQLGNCSNNVSCLWAFYSGSPYNYACGGYPAQAVVPFGNAAGQYLNNEVWSPWMENAGAGNEYLYEFDVMRDLRLDNLVFFVWHIRSLVGNCPGRWEDFNFVYYSADREWNRQRFAVGTLVEPGATHLQLAFGVVDMCGVWCGSFGSGGCHSNGPLFDNPRLLRVNLSGPRWDIQDINQFQDNFAGDGTLTGTVRADMANDLLPSSASNIIPGDSAVVLVADPEADLAVDPTAGGSAVYCYVSVWPQGQPGKSGIGLQAPETRNGSLRYPVVGTWTDASGVEWTCVRADTAGIGGGYYVPLDRYCVDLRDDLFTPGDTICFFYAARNVNNEETYAYGSSLALTGIDRETAAANPSEFTCLPAGGYHRGGNVLYVDGMDGRGSQPYWDSAFASLGLLDKVDRYDVRGPSSAVGNRPASRVADPYTQVLGVYRSILWDCGNLAITLGDGSGYPEKTDDFGLLNTFLNSLSNPGGVLLMGDDVPDRLIFGSASAVTFRTSYIPFSLTSADHSQTFGLSPALQPVNGGCYDDSFVLAGACPVRRDFDVLTPSGATTMEMAYGTPATTNGAVIGKTTNNGSSLVNVLLAGFGFDATRDDDINGVSDRAQFLASSLAWLGTGTNQPTPVGSAPVNSLAQNYPNPFNPQTTIAFSLKSRGVVTLAIYNVAGERVRTLADEAFAAGAHTKVWDGRNDAGSPVSSGIYFYRLTAPGFSQTRKMVLLK